jgi:hypothetical protein
VSLRSGSEEFAAPPVPVPEVDEVEVADEDREPVLAG